MTSGTFDLIPISSITVDRPNRQRRELEKLDELAHSIRENGLINPITVTKDRVLIAGERRLEAHKLLGFDTIAVQFAEDMDPKALHLIELEENVCRVDLSWQDHVLAVSDYHRLQRELNPEWSQEDTAKSLNRAQGYIASHLAVREAMDEGVKEVLEAPQFSVASNFTARRNERRKASTVRDLSAELEAFTGGAAPKPDLAGEVITPDEAEAAPSSRRYLDIQQADFFNWSKEVQTEPFNFIHVDFPYGVNVGSTTGQSGAKSYGGYDDSKDLYFSLLAAFCNNLDNFCAGSAHLMFWFSMDYYQHTYDALTAAGWVVNRFPLIWHKTDNTGILPDKDRGPRRIYETAFFAARGDRKIVRAVGNTVGSAVVPGADRIHMNQKPRAVLEHFFRMTVDDSSRVLDPTCGSGASVAVAESMGARWSLGLELNQEYVDRAREEYDL